MTAVHLKMQLRLLPINPATATLSDKTLPLVQSQSVKNGCFSDYLSYGPDLEALAIDPDNDNIIIVATEDAYGFELTGIASSATAIQVQPDIQHYYYAWPYRTMIRR